MNTGFASNTACIALALLLSGSDAMALENCARPQDVLPIRVAALQQDMMVAAYVCRDVAAYNLFVTTHQAELQDLDKSLMGFFQETDAQAGFNDYNLFKTELANAASLQSINDSQFCRRANADFRVALGHSTTLAQLVPQMPYPVDTGSVRCMPGWYPTVRTAAATPIATPHVHRSWFGRLVDSIF